MQDWGWGEKMPVQAGEGSKHGVQELGGSQAVWLLFSIKY